MLNRMPVPTRWRCECGQVHTTEQRCDRPAPWEREDARIMKECAALAEDFYENGRRSAKSYWLSRRDERARMRRSKTTPDPLGLV